MSAPPLPTLAVVLVQPNAWSADAAVNLMAVREALLHTGPLDDTHVVVLPELVGATMAGDRYAYEICELAGTTGAWVVGGSHYAVTGPMVNAGLIAAPDGSVVARYEKRNPYGIEHDHGVQRGERSATFSVGGRAATVLLCADAWFAELFIAPQPAAELILVPSFTITRRPPAFARALWQHLAVARAYEFGAYVVVADWRVPATYHGLPAAGVSGVADPFPTAPDRYFLPAGDGAVFVQQLDLTRLDDLRDDRLARRFSRAAITDAARADRLEIG